LQPGPRRTIEAPAQQCARRSDLGGGLRNYHELPPYLHPEFERLRRVASDAIRASQLPVQADPQGWGQPIFPQTLERQLELNPPPHIPRERALRDRELRRRSRVLYDQQKGIFRGRSLEAGGTADVKWAGGRLEVLTPAAPGAFAASVALAYRGNDPLELSAEVDIDCDDGVLGLGLLDENKDLWLDRTVVHPGRDWTAVLRTPAAGQPIQLVVYNGGDGDMPARGSIGAVRITAAGIGQPLEWSRLSVHNADPLDDGTNPLGRQPRFACKAVYYNLYINEFFYRVAPCCFLTKVPGFEEARLDGDMTFMQAWNSPGMVELRRRLAKGPLFGACLRCPEKW
jgi:hypothetical protein